MSDGNTPFKNRLQLFATKLKANICYFWSVFSQTERTSFILFAVLLFLVAIILFCSSSLDKFPTYAGAFTTAIFAFLAYRFAKEKFRLELFEKRWSVYEKVLEFCSRVVQVGGIRNTPNESEAFRATLAAAEGSFKSIGFHKTKALFGDDIHQLFEKLNQSYSWLASFSERPSDPEASASWPQQMHDHTMFIWNTVNELPEKFKPYIYFGDYRR
ncbi:MAG: hypothetical protein ABI230_03375 [Aestuariivirga sp.]